MHMIIRVYLGCLYQNVSKTTIRQFVKGNCLPYIHVFRLSSDTAQYLEVFWQLRSPKPSHAHSRTRVYFQV